MNEVKHPHGMIALLLLVASASLAQPKPATSVLEIGRYRLQSNPWVNLHQRHRRNHRSQ